MTKVGFITYNTIGKESRLPNGWLKGPEGRKAFLIQNSKGNRFAVDQLLGGAEKPPAGYSRDEDKYIDLVRDEIATLWKDLQEVLFDLDHIVVYVGAHGSEHAITFASQLSVSKITFVACDCNLPLKELLIRAAGMMKVQRVLCECGGRQTMKLLLDNFLVAGKLLPKSVLNA